MENPTKLIITKARARNFLSYGNEWQEITFPKGLTLVQGFNIDTGKSNGSGKSSITEMIPFALFGKTIKDLPQTKIVNWNNRSSCEVHLFFDIGGKSYVFKRGLKPNKFKVSCDGLDIVRSADIRVFQSQMEEEVIGMDFKTFKNLIYFSPNNTISILGAKKEQKRQFLESLFDLSEYSDLLKAVNGKIGVTSDKVKEIDFKKLHASQTIDLLNRDIGAFKPLDISDNAINKLTFELSAMNDTKIDDFGLFEYDDTKRQIEKLNGDRVLLYNNLADIRSKIKYLQKSIDDTDISKLEVQTNKLNEKIGSTESFISSIENDYTLYGIQVEEISKEIEEKIKRIEEYQEKLQGLSKDRALRSQLITTSRKNIATLQNTDKLDDTAECPLCKSVVNHFHIALWYDDEIGKEEGVMKGHLKIFDDISEMIVDIEHSAKITKEKRAYLEEEVKSKQLFINDYNKSKQVLDQLKENLSMLPDLNEIKGDLAVKGKELVVLKEQETKATWSYDLILEEISIKESKIKDLDILKKKIDDHKARVDNLVREIETEKKNRENLLVIKKQQEDQIEAKKVDITNFEASIVTYDGDIRKLNKMLDHLNYMRTALKDENVKQFAISALLPYLNYRANHYLSESGFLYMVTIDGWLEVIIRGMGTEDVGYTSLSGGESKAMDMAVQLACNDIAELQARTSLGIAIYDEILDTSLDADGVKKLMDIIRVKQQETQSCILIITHRDEIKELEFDNNIMINKKNGFSTVQH